VTVIDRLLRAILTSVYALLRAAWFVRRPKTFGAHALPLTPEGRIILVRLRYAPGWRLPGGGRKPSEPPLDAALRELREEIGMVSHGEAKAARDFEELAYSKRDTASLVIVRDVLYRPRWSWEVEEVREAEVDKLPADMSPTSSAWIESLRPML
jgi:8-oxo-dGTP pyrophosphatase MutT (NUDIX family)